MVCVVGLVEVMVVVVVWVVWVVWVGGWLVMLCRGGVGWALCGGDVWWW